MCVNERTSQLFAISLVSTVVFNLDVQVQTAFTSIVLLATEVRANEVLLDLTRSTAHVLLSVLHLLSSR